MNANVEKIVMTVPTSKEIWTRIGGRTFGRRWRNMILRRPEPEARALSMNVASFVVSVRLRPYRAYKGHQMMIRARAMLNKVRPIT